MGDGTPYEVMYRKTGPVCDQDDGAYCADVTGAETLLDSFPCALTGLSGSAVCQQVRCHGSMKLLWRNSNK